MSLTESTVSDALKSVIDPNTGHDFVSTRLLKNLNGTLQEVMMNFFLNRVIPESSRARI